MIIVRLDGGLGNQLFQYAAALSFARENNCELMLDARSYSKDEQHGGVRLHNMNIHPLKVIGKDERRKYPGWVLNIVMKAPLLSKIPFLKIAHEAYGSPGMKKQDYALMIGYWQSRRYFDGIFSELKSVFIPKEISSSSVFYSEAIMDESSVAIHVRRGDYISNKRALKNHGICGLNYYRQAMDYIEGRVCRPKYFVFSDDLQWVEENMESLFSGRDVSYVNGGSQEEDLWLMSLAKHNIIANSSFSWWGAYLGSSDGQIVVCPYPWYDKRQKFSLDPSLDSWVGVHK
ncbi:alpha-1,2-fucosyltransferase [Halomonas sp. YLGW01]|uniref:alpha-1,2-fucosyltransferase n=1 Tax=Halomonas sp. YLGW01 TaxID=2773308 RepID=UPI00178609F6|nr:alpha-1,2-fucosyltransferase [Halomonas sp. YLGW01]